MQINFHTATMLLKFFIKLFFVLIDISFLKLVSAVVYQIFISHQMIPLQKLWKMFLFHLKYSFRSWDTQIFVFLSSPLFPPVSHCFSSWSLWRQQLSKNLVTHFASYLQKEIRCDTETLSVIKVSSKEHFYGKNMQKICTKS